MSNTISALTKEQLFACLKYDKVEVDADTIENARNNDGEALGDIGYEYDDGLKDYSKAMMWYRLAANQNDPAAQNNIGVMYADGQGVPQDWHIAMEYYLKAAGNSNNMAMGNITLNFLEGNCVLADKYKALEWYSQSGIKPERIKKLNREGIHLKKEDKKKTIYQLINEAEDVLREVRKKNESKLTKENQELKRIKLSNEQELAGLQTDNQNIQNESQQKQQKINLLEEEKHKKSIENASASQLVTSLQQQLKSKDEIIESLKRENTMYQQTSHKATDMFDSLMQSKNNEITLLKEKLRHSGLEQENHELKRKFEELQDQMTLVDNSI